MHQHEVEAINEYPKQGGAERAPLLDTLACMKRGTQQAIDADLTGYIRIHGLNCKQELAWHTNFAHNMPQQVPRHCVICLHKVNEAHKQGGFLTSGFLQMTQGKELVLGAQMGAKPRLNSRPQPFAFQPLNKPGILFSIGSSRSTAVDSCSKFTAQMCL